MDDINTALTTSVGTKALDSAVVHKTGVETIAGVKTFSSLPTIPTTPAVSTDAAAKAYVDAQFNALSGGYGAPVGTIALLRALASASLVDMQLRLVEGVGAIYRYDTSGTGTDDGVGTIKPTDQAGNGRWFKVQAATQDHESLVNLLGGATNDHQHLSTAQVALLLTAAQQSALAGSSGTPGSANKYVTNTDSRLSDSRVPGAHASTHLGSGADPISIATPTVAGLLSAADKTKLDASTTVVFVDNEVPSGVVNGVNAVFTRAFIPSPATSLHLYVNGVRQRLGVQYSLASLTITFTAGNIPLTGNTVVADYRK